MFENDYFVKPVEGHDDVFAFRHDFLVEGKAAGNRVVEELDDGDLIIEGLAASFDGLDRQKENFVENCFQRGIKSFLDGQAVLCFHHNHDQVIGRVLDLREEEGKGLWLRARVDKQEPGSPLYHIYNGIRKGSINALSVGGFFKRALIKGRRMIADVDFTEVSACGVPVHPKTKFAVVAGKALGEDLAESTPVEPDFTALQESLNQLGTVLTRFSE
jgi:HK97 family phage prohead protease